MWVDRVEDKVTAIHTLSLMHYEAAEFEHHLGLKLVGVDMNLKLLLPCEDVGVLNSPLLLLSSLQVVPHEVQEKDLDHIW